MTATLILAGLGLFSRPALAVDSPHTSDCSACHSLHGASYPNLLGELCESCHFEGGPAPAVQTHSSRTIDNGYGNWDLDCWACHNPHTQEQDNTWGTTWGMFLKVDLNAEIKEIDPTDTGPYYTAISTLRTVSGTNIKHVTTTDFVDGDGNSDDDICQACHESTAYYNTGSELNYHANYGTDSQPGGDCTQCHTHEKGFKPSGCTGCHATARGTGGYRRQVVDVGGDFERTSHHVSDGTTTEIVGDGDCVTCHDQSWHQSNTDPEVYLNDPDGGASFSYDGTGGSIENFCLHCHDALGPEAYDTNNDPTDGYQPFTDNKTPTDIDTTWTTSGHGTTTVAAIADEGCLACHGGTDSTRTGTTVDRNVHGSDNAHLLSTTVNGTTITAFEEDLCYACHDGATASTDIQSEFAKGTNGTYIYHHPVDDAEQSAGRSVECSDCHDPHAASSADPVAGASGVDLNGNTVAAGSTVEEYEVCLKCHGDDYNTSRSRTTNKRTDFDPTNSAYHAVGNPGHNTSEAMQLSLAAAGLDTSTVLECSDCHNSDATGTTLGLASNYTGPDPVGPHGSTNPYLLRAYYLAEPTATTYDPANFELCFLCHSEANLKDKTKTNFKEHNKHFKEGATCSYCHYNTHSNENAWSNTYYRIDGTLYTSGPPAGYKTRNIAFAPGVVTGSTYAKPTWGYNSTGTRRYCWLTCHGEDHTPKDYTPDGGLAQDSWTY